MKVASKYFVFVLCMVASAANAEIRIDSKSEFLLRVIQYIKNINSTVKVSRVRGRFAIRVGRSTVVDLESQFSDWEETDKSSRALKSIVSRIPALSPQRLKAMQSETDRPVGAEQDRIAERDDNTRSLQAQVSITEKIIRRPPKKQPAARTTNLYQLAQGGIQVENWAEAATKIYPQFAPRKILSKYAVVHKKLDEYSLYTYVIVDGRRYSYVSEKDKQRWNVSWRAMRKAALKNLDRIAVSDAVRFRTGKYNYVVVKVKDPFGASRILSRKFRRHVIKHVGEEFFAAMPNRDYLICFNRELPDSELEKIKKQAEKDYRVRPYPVSKNIFLVALYRFRILK